MRVQLRKMALVSPIVRAVLSGSIVTAVLAGVVLLAWSRDSELGRVAGNGVGYWLGPGALAGYACGARRIHDVGFWYLTLALDAIFYSLFFFIAERLWRRHRRAVHRDDDCGRRAHP